MCGIVGYIGHREAYPVILKGLQRLEYRGYDSAGIALYDGNEIKLSKTKGKVADLESKVSNLPSFSGNLGIGHTRWATHGVPNDEKYHMNAYDPLLAQWSILTFFRFFIR